MAIHKFQQDEVLDLELLAGFINSNKEGTFLEDVTITAEAVSSETIKRDLCFYLDGENDPVIKVSSKTSSGTGGFIFYGSAITKEVTSDVNYSPLYFKECIFCNNGLILSFSNGGSSAPLRNIAITVDSGGNLAVLMPQLINSNYSRSQICAVGYNSTMSCDFTLLPKFGAVLTALSPVSVIAGNDDSALPYLFTATQTQQSEEGCGTATDNGTVYATNGLWYIKDGE